MINRIFKITFLYILFLTSELYGQAPNYLWANTGGGEYFESGTDIACDPSNNVIVIGDFYSNYAIFNDDTLYNTTMSLMPDIFVVKYNPTGNIIWAKSFGGTKNEWASGVCADAFGNLYITGYFCSATISFGSTVLINTDTSGIYEDYFLVKLDPLGNVIWAKSNGGTKNDYGGRISIDPIGNIVVSGFFDSPSISFGATILPNPGTTNPFLIKYDEFGNVLWARTANGNNDASISGMAIDPVGNIFVTGSFYSPNITFGTTTLNNAGGNGGYNDIFLVKYSSSGNVLWAKKAGTSNEEGANNVATDASGNVYLIGYFGGTSLTMGTTTLLNATSGANYDMFIAKYNPNGSVLWAKSKGTNGTTSAIGITTDALENVTITGFFEGDSITLGSTNLINAGFEDMFICQYNSSGNVLWAMSAAGNDSDFGGNIKTDFSQNLITTGFYEGSSLTFGVTNVYNPNPEYEDMYVYKLSNCSSPPIATITGIPIICNGEKATLTVSGFGGYLWNTGSSTSSISVSPTVNTSYSAIVSNGCGSDTALFTLTVNSKPTAIISGNTTICQGQSSILSAYGGSNYLWNSNDTSSNITISPTHDTAYSVIVSNNGCLDTAIVSITVNIPQVASFKYDSIQYCQNEGNLLPSFIGNGVGGIFTSSGNLSIDPNSGNIDLSNTPPGTYTIVNNIGASGACPASFSAATITVFPGLTVNVSGDTTINIGSSTYINVTGGTTYSWSPTSDLSCTNCPNPIATPPNTTTYTVTISDTNGCALTKSINITINDEFELFVPDVFSPNNDGQNDILLVRGSGIKELTFVIYDRLGEKIFETNNKDKGWDGTYKGSILNSGVFVYFLSATMINDKTIKTKGDITLIR